MFRRLAEANIDPSAVNVPTVTADSATLTGIVNAILSILGVIAVIFIILGAITYATSGGDQQKISKAKSSILYAVVGLIVVIASFAIVNFVLEQF